MNIFVLDREPEVAARYHNDRHVVKMILESAQLLSTAHHVLDGRLIAVARLPWCLKPTHVNHPCARWLREAKANYQWVHSLMQALIGQYAQRFHKVHKYGELGGVLDSLRTVPLNIPITPLTPFAQAMPNEYKRSDAVLAYRLYYYYEKKHLAEWRAPSVMPQWWRSMAENEISKGRFIGGVPYEIV